MPIDQSHDHLDPNADRAQQDQYVPMVEQTMPLGDHLEELRSRLIKCLIGVVIAAIGTFYFGFDLISLLSAPYVQAMDMHGYEPQMVATDPTIGFTSVFLPVVIVAAIIVVSPWLLWQLWQFIVIGLYDNEKRAVHILAPFSTVMTLLAVAFTYKILLPISLMFFLNFATLYPPIETSDPGWLMQKFGQAYGLNEGRADVPDEDLDTVDQVFPVINEDPEEPQEGQAWVNRRQGSLKVHFDGETHIMGVRSKRLLNPLPKLGEYIRFATFMIFGIVLAFQTPVVMMVLGWTGMFNPYVIAKARKYAIFVCAIAGAILTPTDIGSMIVLAVPLYTLFEFGLILMKLSYGKREPADAEA